MFRTRRATILFGAKAAALGTFAVLPLKVTSPWLRMHDIAGNSHGMFGVAVFVALWVLCLAALFAAAALPTWRARTLLAVLIVPSTLASVIYYDIAGKEVLYQNIEDWWLERALILSAAATYKQVLPSAGMIFVVGALAILLPPQYEYLAECFTMLRARRSRSLTLGAHVLSVGIMFVLAGVLVVQAGEGLNGLPPYFKSSTMLSLMWINQQIAAKTRASTKVTIQRTQPSARPPNIVLVVNESLRADFLDINHDRGITPFLVSQRDRIYNFGYASSIANCSSKTNQGLRIGLSQADVVGSQRRNPYVWQYAKQAGYRTIFIEGQVGPGRANNEMSSFERGLIDQIVYLSSPADDPEVWTRDLRIQKKLDELLADAEHSQPYFIYVVLYGVHSPYDDKYPPSARRFPLSGPSGAPLGAKERLINSYKNGVSWLVDGFFKAMLADGRTYPSTVVIYTSDHGQNLLDDGHPVTHCTLKNPTFYEGLVPLMVITDQPELAPRFAEAARKNKDKATHFNIVPTILALMGYDSAGIEKQHGSSLFDTIQESRRFLSDGIRINVSPIGIGSRVEWHGLPDTLVSDADDS